MKELLQTVHPPEIYTDHGLLGFVHSFLANELVISRDTIQIESLVDALLVLQKNPSFQQRPESELHTQLQIYDQQIQEEEAYQQSISEIQHTPLSLLNTSELNKNVTTLIAIPSFFEDLRDYLIKKNIFRAREKYDVITPATVDNTFLMIPFDTAADNRECLFVLNQDDRQVTLFEDPLRHAARFVVSMESFLRSKHMQDKGFENERAKDFAAKFIPLYITKAGIEDTPNTRLLLDYYMTEQALLKFSDGRIQDGTWSHMSEYSRVNLEVAADYFSHALSTYFKIPVAELTDKEIEKDQEYLDVYFDVFSRKKSGLILPSKEVFKDFLGRRVMNIILTKYIQTENEYKEAIFLAKRSQEKSTNKGSMEFIGGHLRAGEFIEIGAKRELEEESHISPPLTYKGNIAFLDKQGAGILVDVWFAEYDGPLTLNTDEIDSNGSGFFTLEEIQKKIDAGVPFTMVAKNVLIEHFNLKFPEE